MRSTLLSALLLFGAERGLDSLPEEVDAEIHAGGQTPVDRDSMLIIDGGDK